MLDPNKLLGSSPRSECPAQPSVINVHSKSKPVKKQPTRVAKTAAKGTDACNVSKKRKGADREDEEDEEDELDDADCQRDYVKNGVKLEVIQLPVDYDTEEWLRYIKPSNSVRGPWRCKWVTRQNGRPMICDYRSKRHLVKRHIEATHLHIK